MSFTINIVKTTKFIDCTNTVNHDLKKYMEKLYPVTIFSGKSIQYVIHDYIDKEDTLNVLIYHKNLSINQLKLKHDEMIPYGNYIQIFPDDIGAISFKESEESFDFRNIVETINRLMVKSFKECIIVNKDVPFEIIIEKYSPLNEYGLPINLINPKHFYEWINEYNLESMLSKKTYRVIYWAK